MLHLPNKQINTMWAYMTALLFQSMECFRLDPVYNGRLWRPFCSLRSICFRLYLCRDNPGSFHTAPDERVYMTLHDSRSREYLSQWLTHFGLMLVLSILSSNWAFPLQGFFKNCFIESIAPDSVFTLLIFVVYCIVTLASLTDSHLNLIVTGKQQTCDMLFSR